MTKKYKTYYNNDDEDDFNDDIDGGASESNKESNNFDDDDDNNANYVKKPNKPNKKQKKKVISNYLNKKILKKIYLQNYSANCFGKDSHDAINTAKTCSQTEKPKIIRWKTMLNYFNKKKNCRTLYNRIIM